MKSSDLLEITAAGVWSDAASLEAPAPLDASSDPFPAAVAEKAAGPLEDANGNDELDGPSAEEPLALEGPLENAVVAAEAVNISSNAEVENVYFIGIPLGRCVWGPPQPEPNIGVTLPTVDGKPKVC